MKVITLDGKCAGTASEIFRNVANSVLSLYRRYPVWLGEELFMLKNGIAPVGEETTETDSKEDKGLFEDVKEEASNMVDDAKKATDEADIPGKRKRLGYLQRLAWFL